MDDSPASAQLAAIARVTDLFERAGIDHWLFGGWAVDFYVGSVTRGHYDVDIAVWHDDLPRVAQLLEDDGWRHAPDPDEDGGTGYEREGVRLELTYLVADDNGVSVPLRGGNVVWSKEPLGPHVEEFEGVRARIIPLELLMRGKSSPRDDPEEGAKDRADFARLSELTP